mgnify:CR=1 FL=1
MIDTTLVNEIVSHGRDLNYLLRDLAMPVDPGEDTDYVCPSRFTLPLLQDALANLHTATDLAYNEVPEHRRERLKKERNYRLDAIEAAAATDATVARYYAHHQIEMVVGWLIDLLTNEGRPQPKPDLTLAKKGKRK